jgi:hypothetical protein
MSDEQQLREGRINVVLRSDIGKCPFLILVPSHYRKDGSCKCSNREHREMMIRDWNYRPELFASIPLID